MTDIFDIESPFPGVFYRRSAIDKPPLVEVGDTVTPGQSLGMIEIMKQFAPIDAPVAGTLVEICAEDGQNVDPGTVIFRVRPSHG